MADIIMSTSARNMDITVTTSTTATKACRTCTFVGNMTLSNSCLASLKNLEIDSMLPSCGRPRGTRTPDTWFWRPVLYQLSYWPIFGEKKLRASSLCVLYALCTTCNIFSTKAFQSYSSCFWSCGSFFLCTFRIQDV